MIRIAAIIAAVLVFLGFKGREKSQAAGSAPTIDFLPAAHVEKTLDEMYHVAGRQWGLDWKLLKAIAQVESNEDPNAKNPTDPSYGLMQILCISDGKGGCKNRLNVLDWPPEAGAGQLYDPEYSLKIGAQVLSWNIEQYGILKGIAVYNNWGARSAPNDGPFPNQGYVDKVCNKYRALGGSVGRSGGETYIYS